MGRQAFPIIGGVIGAVVVGIYSGGTAALQGYAAGFSLGAAIGGIAGSYIDPLVLQGNKVGDASLQVAAEGGARAIMYGRASIAATCVVARGNRKVTKKKQSNGKGSSGSTVNETVTWTFAIGLGEAIVGSSISRIWQDENIVYDVIGGGPTVSSGGVLGQAAAAALSHDDNAAFAKKFRFYDGSETQLPDADLQVFLGEDTPYFRGTAYVVFPNFDLTKTAERVPTFRFEVLNGVVGIVDQLENLEWSFPNPFNAGTSQQSTTLTGNASSIYDVDLYFTGSMETRHYTDAPVVVGGNGRFVTAHSGNSSDYSAFNIYRITISDPPQTYYMNQFVDETSPILINPDGSDAWKLSIQVAGNATIEYFADAINGSSAFGPQYGKARAEIRGSENGGGTTIPLGDVIADMMKKAGMTEDKFDVSELSHVVAGVCIQDTTTGVDAINACVQPFFIDPTEIDGVLKFVKRGSDIVRTLTIDDLTEVPDSSTRENSIEYPAKLHLYYQSPITGYATTKATSYRYSPQADSSGEGSVTAPVTFYDSDEPAQIAQKLHKVMWTEADGSFSWVVGMHCIDLVGSDVVGLYLRGIATRARITAVENDGSSLTLTLIKDRQSSYTSNVTGIPLPTATPPQPTTMSKAVLGILDIPALQDTDDALVYYSAMSGSTSTWNGGQLQRSLDGGSSWTPIGEVSTDVTMGKLTVAMGATIREYTDTTNVVTVQLFDSNNDLIAYSDTTFHQEQGAIAIQSDNGDWEVLQYRDVADGGAGLWTLSTLQRGRLNTAATTHSVGALFVLLDPSQMVKNSAQSAWLDGVMKHRAVSYGSSSEDATIVTTTYEGNSQREWSPASATAQYDGSTVAIRNIVPRHRFGTEVNPIASANFIGFRVTVSVGSSNFTTDISGGSAYVTVGSTAPTQIKITSMNKITGEGGSLTITDIERVPAATLVPEAIVNAGGA